MKPSKKAPELEALLEATTGRSSAIAADRCLPGPFGCEGPAIEFRDALSRKEYGISGLCQKCQDSIFNPEGL